MNFADGVLVFALLVTVTGLGGLAFMYSYLRRTDSELDLPKP